MLRKSLARTIDYQKTFSTEHGKRVLTDMMDLFFMKKPTFNPKNMYETAFREGQRNVVLRILAQTNNDIYKLKEMIEQEEENDRINSTDQ